MADRLIKPPKLYHPGERKGPPHVCVFGRGGFGKTTLIGTMPGRGLVVETPQPEGNGDWVIEYLSDRVQVVYVDEWNEVDDIYWWLRDSDEPKKKFQWVAWDTITGLKQFAISKVVKDRDRSLALNPHKITLPEWGTIGQMLGDLIFKSSLLSFPTIWMAQEKRYGEEDDDNTKIKMIGPNMTQASLDVFLPIMSMVARLTAIPDGTGGYDRRVRLGSHPRMYTKARAANPSIVIPNSVRIASPPTTELYDIMQYLRGKPVELDVVNEEDTSVLIPDQDIEVSTIEADEPELLTV